MILSPPPDPYKHLHCDQIGNIQMKFEQNQLRPVGTRGGGWGWPTQLANQTPKGHQIEGTTDREAQRIDQNFHLNLRK